MRQIEIAVGIECTAEFVGNIFQVGLYCKFRHELIFNSGMISRTFSPESLGSLLGGSVGDHAQFARQALPRDGWIALVVIALSPLWI